MLRQRFHDSRLTQLDNMMPCDLKRLCFTRRQTRHHFIYEKVEQLPVFPEPQSCQKGAIENVETSESLQHLEQPQPVILVAFFVCSRGNRIQNFACLFCALFEHYGTLQKFYVQRFIENYGTYSHLMGDSLAQCVHAQPFKTLTRKLQYLAKYSMSLKFSAPDV